MARTLPKATGAAIETALQIAHNRGKPADMVTIAAIFDTTYESVSRIRRRMVRFQQTGIDDRKKPGPRPLKDQDESQVADAIRVLLNERPELDQKGISEVLFGQFGVHFGQSTISRLMKNKGIPHKRTNKFYKKTKLVSTHPEGQVMPLPSERLAAAVALTGMTMPNGGGSYSSPYSSIHPPEDVNLEGTYEDIFTPAMSGMEYQTPYPSSIA